MGLNQPPNLGLLTDLYELTMAYGYWKLGMHNQDAVFYVHYRKKPFNDSYAIAAGLGTFIEYIDSFSFSGDDLEYLRSLALFEEGFLEELKSLSFSCDIDAVPEGRYVYPYEPIVRVSGPIFQAQLLESALLCIINYQTLVATKASHICNAAGADEVVEFGLRRAQGINGALAGARGAFIGGCQSTSNTLAGKLYDIPVRGTMAHSWVMAFDSEEEAFSKWHDALPKSGLYLVDTYDSIDGVKKAIKAAKGEMVGIRLDSGDLLSLSILARKELDNAGLSEAKIMASNELDEKEIRRLKDAGAKIDVWGVGTHLITSKSQPALDGVYKLSAIKDENGTWQYKAKRSEEREKSTLPGILQIKRSPTGDVIYDCEIGYEAEGEDLLVPIYRNGKCVYTSPSLVEMQKREKLLPNVCVEPRLQAIKEELLK